MRTTLGISILLNAVLAGGLLFLWVDRRPPPIHAIAPVTTPPPSPAAPPPVMAPPFHWSQLDSPDYHVYVRNLRAIGCPAGSLRAIVTADADAVYNQRQLCLEQKLSDISQGAASNPPAGAGSPEPALRNELQRLPDQEASLIAELLGRPPASQPVTAVAPAPTINPPLTPANEPAAWPLVLQEFDPATLNLSDDQQRTIASVRQNFLDQIGGPNQDPRDPAYLNRWQNAQLAADNMMQGMLGSDIYIKFQMLQMMAQNQANQPSPQN